MAQQAQTKAQVITENPLDGEELLVDAFFEGPVPKGAVVESKPTRPMRAPKPTHYRIVSISLYERDIDRLDGLVRELKKRGHSKANKSELIRKALQQVNLDKIARAD